MEPKETALDDFLKALKVSLNFILLYSTEHKSFLHSLDELKVKTEAALAFFEPFEIAFSPDALLIDQTRYAKIALHKDLASLFHLRKIRSLTIRRGVAVEELKTMLGVVARPPKEIIRAGGAGALLEAAGGLAHCAVEDLDYSQLLKGGSEEIKDVWTFMLKKAVSSQGRGITAEFAGNFELMAGRVGMKEMLGDEELYKNMQGFLAHLSQTDRDTLLRVSSALLGAVVQEGRGLMDAATFGRAKELLSHLTAAEFAGIVWRRISTDEHFDAASFEVFSKLVDAGTHDAIAQGLAGLADQAGTSLSSGTRKKIQQLFFSIGAPLISEVYRKALSRINEESVTEAAYVFDRAQVTYNYRFILLDLLMSEPLLKRLPKILSLISNDWDALVAEKNPEYWRCLFETVQKRHSECASINEFTQVRTRMFEFLEALCWEDSVAEGFQELLAQVAETSFNAQTYLTKIFDENRVSTQILRFFFRFFSRDMNGFYERLKEKNSDLELMSRIMEAVADLQSPQSREVLEAIYGFSNDVLKLEALRCMQKLKEYDRAFIFDVLANADTMVKKQAFMLLSDRADILKAIETLILMPNPWARNNTQISANLDLLVELECRQALEYIESLENMTAFWNIPLKRKIGKVKGMLHA